MRLKVNNNYITVSQLNKYLKYKFDNDSNLVGIYLKGEISNFKAHSRGHYYFTLKDEESRINAVMFAGNASKMKFNPEDGMKVLITGRVSVYETSGSYQIYVEEMLEDGIGNLYLAFEQLKKKLEAEGLFASSHKKEIPKIPKRIGIITAPTGAAIKDILSTLKRRWPIAETILFPCLVQGEFAKDDIVKNLELAKNYELDVIILGRGGGSIEDLWPFNEEVVARSIYDHPVPIISAVGHEVDFTISDYVADLRAATPTGAAELAVPDKNDVSKYLSQITLRLSKNIMTSLNLYNKQLSSIKNSYILTNPNNLYLAKEQYFDSLYERLKLPMANILLNSKKDLINLTSKVSPAIIKQLEASKNKYSHLLVGLEVVNPIATIKRGYSVTRSKSKIITSVKELKKGDKLEIELSDGKVDSQVI